MTKLRLIFLAKAVHTQSRPSGFNHMLESNVNEGWKSKHENEKNQTKTR
jgi:hypothetical protein